MKSSSNDGLSAISAALVLTLGLAAGGSGAASGAEPAPPSAAASAGGASETALTVSALLGRFQRVPSVTARYEETKQIALLSTPLKTTGVVVFERHGGDSVGGPRLARRADPPYASHIVVAAGQVRVFGPDGAEAQAIDNPVAAQLSGSFMSVLGGDEAALKAHYAVQLSGTAARWSLTLTPKGAQLARLITKIELRGGGAEITTVVVYETSGDVTTTRFADVKIPHGLSPDRRAAAFPASASKGR